MRKIFLVLVVILWIAAGIQLVDNLNREDEGKIVEAFNHTNCMDAESKVQASGQITNGYKTKEEQSELLGSIAEALGIVGSHEITEEREENRTTVKLYKKAVKAETTLQIVSVENEISENMVETTQYLLVEICLYDNLECAVLYKENLESIMRNCGMVVDLSLQFSGELQGKLEEEEREAIAEHLFDDISAKKQQKLEEDGIYTVYAYTELIDEYQKVKGRNVNVTIAVTYDEEKNRTKLYLATPFMKEDY